MPSSAVQPSGREPLLVAGATAVVLAVGLWRITLGAGLGDDAHVIGLALRMAQGDLPFADEMNPQALGSVWAVPFVWVWTHAVGLDGLVIAARAFCLAFALGCGTLAYRALRVSFRAVVAATAVAVPLLAPPYNLLDPSYNTAPIALGVVAVCAAHAGLAARGTPSGRRWALVAGVATAATVFSNPLTVVGGVVLVVALALLARRRDVIVPLLLGAAVVTGLALTFFAIVGVGSIRSTLDYAATYRSISAPLSERLARHVQGYVLYLWRPVFVPAAAAALLACVPWLPRRLRAVAVAGAAAGVVVPSFLAEGPGNPGPRVGIRPAMGTLPAVTVVLLVVVLALPVVAWAVRRRRRDVGSLLALGLPTAVASVPLVAAGTLSTAAWGAAAIGAAPAVTAVVAGWGVMITRAWGGFGAAAQGALVGAVLALLVLTPFGDPTPRGAHVRIAKGAYAGVSMPPSTADTVAWISDVTSRWLRPGDGILFYGLPGGYVLVDARVDSNIEWLTDYGLANQSTLDWFARTGRVPRVVVVDWAMVRRAGGLVRIARTDPLMAFVLREYRIVDSGPERPTVLARR
ncbi:MAG: hypothetical protein ACXV1K_03660 [Kineosporiaceae bacterium]